MQLAWQRFLFVQGACADKMSACLQWDTAITSWGLVNVETRIVLTNWSMPSEAVGELHGKRNIVTNRCQPQTIFDSGRPQRLTIKPFELEEILPYVAWLHGQLGLCHKG